MKSFSLSDDLFLLGGINFAGSMALLALFSVLPMNMWEVLNAVWQFGFLFLFLALLFDIVPAFFARLRNGNPDLALFLESFGWIPYVYLSTSTVLAGLDVLGQFRLKFSETFMWMTVLVPVVISMGIWLFSLYGKRNEPAYATKVSATVPVSSEVKRVVISDVKSERKAVPVPVKKAVAKKPVVKKSAVKKVAVKKSAVKKSAPKKK